MIGKDGLENQKNVNKELSATEKSYIELGRRAAQLTEESRSLTEELKDQLGIRSKTNEGEKTLLSLSRQITKSAQENKLALRESGDITKQLIKDEKNLEAAKREQLILSNSILGADKELNKLIQEEADAIVDANSARMASISEIDKLKQQLVGASKEEEKAILSSISKEQERLNIAEDALSLALENADADSQRLALGKQIVIAAEKNVQQSIDQKQKQDKINESMGVAGGLVAGLNAVAGKFAGAFGLKEVEAEMRKVAAATVDAGGEVDRLKTLSAGLKVAFKNLGETLTDPTVIFGALMKGFNDVEKEQQNFRRLTGQNADAFRGINDSLTTTSEYLAGMVTLTKELGVNANVAFSSETVTTVAELTENMGMAGKEAANLAAISKISGTNLQDNLKSTEGQFKNFVKTNKTALNFGQVLSGVANASDSVKLSLGGSQEAIGEAVMEAQKLGLTLDQVDNIAGNLLDFENSIAAEMEAELLTGQQINLEKARELALNNDLAGLAKEIGNNQAVLQSFSTGNRIAQEATAKAMGMSREEMSKMIAQQKIQEGLTTEQVAAAADISLEEAQRLTTQQQITKSIEKMSQAFSPILSVIASLISNSFVLYTTMGVLALSYIPKLVGGMSSFAGSVKEGAKGVKDLASGIFKMATGKGTDKLKDTLLGKAGDKTKEIQESSQGIKGEGPGGFLKSLGGGLKSIGEDAGKVIAGGGALLLSAPGLIAIGLSAPALAILSLINGKALEGVLSGLGKGLASLGEALMGPQLLGLAAGLALLTGSIIGIGFALKLAAPAFEAVGTIITSIFGGIATVITSVAEGFTMMFGTLNSDNIGALLLLGPALLGISTGLVSVAATGLLALPVIGALTALGSVSGALGSMFGDNENSTNQNEDKGSMKAVEAKLDELIAVISAGGDVYIDGAKVGKTIALASSNLG